MGGCSFRKLLDEFFVWGIRLHPYKNNFSFRDCVGKWLMLASLSLLGKFLIFKPSRPPINRSIVAFCTSHVLGRAKWPYSAIKPVSLNVEPDIYLVNPSTARASAAPPIGLAPPGIQSKSPRVVFRVPSENNTRRFLPDLYTKRSLRKIPKNLDFMTLWEWSKSRQIQNASCQNFLIEFWPLITEICGRLSSFC